MLLSGLLSVLVYHLNIAEGLMISSLLKFFQIIRHLKEHLSWHWVPNIKGPTLIMPKKIITFCAAALSVKDQGLILKCWTTLWDIVWGTVGKINSWRDGDLVNLFLKYSIKFKISMFFFFYKWHSLYWFCIGYHNLYSLTWKYLDPHYSEGHNRLEPQELFDLREYHAVLFMRDHGPLLVWSYSAKCYYEFPICVWNWC